MAAKEKRGKRKEKMRIKKKKGRTERERETRECNNDSLPIPSNSIYGSSNNRGPYTYVRTAAMTLISPKPLCEDSLLAKLQNFF